MTTRRSRRGWCWPCLAVSTGPTGRHRRTSSGTYGEPSAWSLRGTAGVFEVFHEYVAPEYSRSGVEKFQRDVTQASLAGALWQGDLILAASVEDDLVGMLQVKTNAHTSLFFVRGGYQRRGIGRVMVAHAI